MTTNTRDRFKHYIKAFQIIAIIIPCLMKPAYAGLFDESPISNKSFLGFNEFAASEIDNSSLPIKDFLFTQYDLVNKSLSEFRRSLAESLSSEKSSGKIISKIRTNPYTSNADKNIAEKVTANDCHEYTLTEFLINLLAVILMAIFIPYMLSRLAHYQMFGWWDWRWNFGVK